MTAFVRAASDTLVLSKRSFFKIRRQPDLLIGFTTASAVPAAGD